MSDVKRYWMEAEGPMGQRVETDESSVEVVLAADYDSLLAQIASLREALTLADSKLSGIQLYAGCETARSEAAKIRAELRAALKEPK